MWINFEQLIGQFQVFILIFFKVSSPLFFANEKKIYGAMGFNDLVVCEIYDF